ncbi:type II toxin-antitoxin system prevent-host-death family antitoxin [Pseudonocardiaceae bacterium YIM PH 21723]|nr:type II toxin-antitoxin system prevent-host-death family antitoxin [Pseudonocardiaceae bacterium YIM PH 21723]
MHELISQRELRNDNAEIMRRVDSGESFTVTRNGKPIADIVPHGASVQTGRRRLTGGEIQARFRKLPPIDSAAWLRDIAEMNDWLGPDEPTDPWEEAERRRAERERDA